MIPDWITLSQTAGTGNATITVTASSNTELSARMASLTVATTSKSAFVTVSQQPATPQPFEYLTFTMLGDGDISFTAENGITLYYTKDYGETWDSITPNRSVRTIPCFSGDVVQFSGDSESYLAYTNAKLISTAPHYVSGDMASLGSANFKFKGFFWGSTGLISAENLVLQQPTYSECFSQMFNGCTSLQKAPRLPFTTLVGYCYYEMFYGCTSLTTAPALPSTNLEEGCYERMFYGCTGLTTPPVLPATTLAKRCYQGMFNRCSSLATAPVLPATTLAINCYSNMFQSCTTLTIAPELPATTLVSYCYNLMFEGCTSLANIKCLATDISASYSHYYWVRYVAPTGTFTKATGVNWSEGVSGIPSGWTVVEE